MEKELKKKSGLIFVKTVFVVVLTFFAGKILIEAMQTVGKAIKNKKLELGREWAEEALADSGLTIKPLPKGLPKDQVIATLFALQNENQNLKIKIETLKGVMEE